MSILTAIVDGCLRHRPLVLGGTIALLVLGVDSARRLSIDAVPDVTNVQVQILTSAPALSPIEIEQYVSVPVERAMSGMPKLSEIRSLSKYGVSVVTVVFQEGTSIYFARQMVQERMAEAQAAVPRQYGAPIMGPISTALGEVYQFIVRGEGYSPMTLEETLDWTIAPALRTVPGVVETLSFGGEDKQYQIVIDPSRLQSAGLSVREVVEALEASNANAGGGYVERNREQIVIGTKGLVHSLDDLKSVVVGSTKEGVPITVATIGDVQFGPRLRRGSASMDGKGEVVVGTALMLMGENARVVTKAIKAKLDEIGPTLPRGMRIEPFYDRSALVDRTIVTVLKNLAEGALLVVLVLFVLLGDLRAGLVVAVTIPLAMSFAVIVMRFFGMSGNLMSLGAIDFGLIVDGAVIIVENSLRRLAADPTGDRRAIIRDATVEVRTASLVGELIIAVVYLPILSLRGIEGKMFTPMAVTVLLALLGAFFCSLTIVPVLSSFSLRPTHAGETRFFRRLRAWYAPVLDAALRRTRLTLTAGVLALCGGVACFLALGSELIPQLDEGDLLVEARRLPGVALTESIASDRRMQEALLAIPEIRHAVSKTGSPELALDPMGIEQTDLYLKLAPQRQWRPGMTKAKIAEQVSQALERATPDVAGAISQPIQMRTNELLAGVRSDIAAQIYGPDFAELRRLGRAVASVVQAVDGAVEVRLEQGADLSYLDVVPDRSKLARYGLRVADVNQLVETIAVGHTAGEVFEGDRRFAMTVRMRLRDPGAVEELRSLPLKSASGQMVPLGDVATLQVVSGPVLVNRDQMSRRLIVELNARGRDVGSVAKEAQEAVARAVEMPDGYRIQWGGQFRHYEEARDRLLFVVPLALALIIGCLWIAFRAAAPALLIFANIPFAAIGGAAALLVRGIPFSISAGVGFIALFGVSVLNGLVLVSFARELEAKGATVREAMRSAAELRLRPVLMTAAVAALGFIPMAVSTTPGSEVQRPLATVVIGGLVGASVLTLLLFPALYVAVIGRRGPAASPKEGGR